MIEEIGIAAKKKENGLWEMRMYIGKDVVKAINILPMGWIDVADKEVALFIEEVRHLIKMEVPKQLIKEEQNDNSDRSGDQGRDSGEAEQRDCPRMENA